MNTLLSVPESNLEWALLTVFASSIWIAFMAMLSWYSGFRSFGRTFTRFPQIKGRKYWLVSLYSGTGPIPIFYPLCFSLTIGEDGIYLEPVFFLRPFHQKMRIGWRSVTGCETSFFSTKVRFVELPISMSFIGRAGAEVHKQLRRYADKN